MLNKEILKKINLGDSVAEAEQESLQYYFIETEAWEMLTDGRVDIVYGGKGTGKSALYLLLLRNKNDLAAKNIHLIPGEEITGEPVFSSISVEDNLDEVKFRNLWKIYFLSLIGNHIKDTEKNNVKLQPILKRLQEEGLIPLTGINRILNVAKTYITKASLAVEHEGMKFSITLGDTSPEDEKNGKISVKNLLQEIDEILGDSDTKIWLLLDRLDVAFDSLTKLEIPALRALFRVYLDFASLKNIKLKIFLRNDIWNRITAENGFREQSHITRVYHIKWMPDALRNLILRRFFNNPVVEDYTTLKKEMLNNTKVQDAAFYSIFPEQVDSGPKQAKTFEWILSRVQDGTRSQAPREVIHLIKSAREHQVQIEEVGGTGGSPQGCLISANALTLALDNVSQVKVETLWSEYPSLKKYIELFKGGKTEHTKETMKRLFDMEKLNDLTNTIRQLVDIGFLQERQRADHKYYWIPFIYRPYLSLTEGAAFPLSPEEKAAEEN